MLGELSSNTKTPASTVKHKRQSTVQKKPQIRVATKQTKVETKGSKDGTKKPAGTALTSQTHRQGVLKEEELPDIELMPASVGKGEDSVRYRIDHVYLHGGYAPIYPPQYGFT